MSITKNLENRRRLCVLCEEYVKITEFSDHIRTKHNISMKKFTKEIENKNKNQSNGS